MLLYMLCMYVNNNNNINIYISVCMLLCYTQVYIIYAIYAIALLTTVTLYYIIQYTPPFNTVQYAINASTLAR